MRNSTIGIFISLLTICFTSDLFAFSVDPIEITADEGTRHVLNLNLVSTDWVSADFDPAACGTGFSYFFKMTFSSTGSATWSNNHTSGDLNLDIGDTAFPLSNEYVLCAHGKDATTINDLSINIHNDTVTGEAGESAFLTINGQCPDAPLKLQKSRPNAICPGSVSISINDTTVIPGVSISGQSVLEDSGSGQFTISLSEAAPPPGFTVSYAVSNKSSANSDDYQSFASSVFFAARETSKVVPVTIIADDSQEPDETIIVNLVAGPAYTLGRTSSATLTILNDDTAGISVDPTQITVAEDGSMESFNVVLQSAPLANATINLTVAPGYEDEVALSANSLAFDADNWDLSQQVTITGQDDLEDDGDQQFNITLSITSEDSFYNSLNGPPVAVTNTDNDATPSISITGQSVLEDSGSGRFTITFSEAASVDLTVSYAVSNGSSANLDDYQSFGSSVLFAAGETSKTVPVTIIADDSQEPDETIIVDLAAGPGYTLGGSPQGTLTILNDDTAGISVAPTKIAVSEDGSMESFNVVLQSAPLADVTINLTVDPGYEDEVALSENSLRFNAENWDSPQEVQVTGQNDEVFDGDQKFNIALSASSMDMFYNGLVVSPVAVTNEENDTATSMAFSMETYTVSEDVGSAEITIIKTGASAGEISGTFSTEDSTATAGLDYTPPSEGRFTLGADVSSKTFMLEIENDTEIEGDEEVILNLNVEGVAVQPQAAKLIIQNDFVENAWEAIDPDSLPPNQKDIAIVILKTCPTGASDEEFQSLCGGIVNEAIQGGSVTAPLKEITPEESAAARSPSTEMSRTQGMNVKSRMVALRGGAKGVSVQGFSVNMAGLSMNANMLNSFMHGPAQNQPSYNMANTSGSTGDDGLADFGRWGVFISGRIIFGKKDPTALESGYKFDTAGITAGVDYRITDTFVAGLALGYANDDVKLRQKGGSLNADGISFTLYGSWYPTDNFYVDGSYNLGSADYKQERIIDYTLVKQAQKITQTINADYNGDQTGINLGAGYDFTRDGWVFGPVFNFEYLDVDIDAYEERLTDAGGVGFDVGWAAVIDRQNYKSMIASIGFDFSKAISRSWGVIIPQANVSWAKEFKNDQAIISGHYVGDVNQVKFNLLTDSLNEDFFRAGIGLSAMFKNNKSAFLMVDGDFGRALLTTYYINAGFRWEF